MPVYEFECGSCGHRFDELMRLSDPDPTHCPACHAETVRRRLSAPQFRLSGGGWYETDFKGDKDKKRNLAGEGAPPKEGGEAAKSDATKGDTGKPAETATKAADKPAPAPAPAPAPSTPSSGSN
jgi:putative FmdB family regulatory protein